MIKAYDTTTKQYNRFDDYIEKFSNDNYYGEGVSVGSITNHSDGLAIYCPGHNFMTGQPVAIGGTTNYDATYNIVTILSDDYVTIDGTYVATEDSGTIYAYMANSYHIAFLHEYDDVFNNVKRKTAYLGSKIKTEQGNLMDDITISDDDETLIDGFMRTAFYEVSRMMKSRSKSIVGGFQFNVYLDQDADGTNGDTAYLLWMIESDETDEIRDTYPVIDEAIARTMEAYILKEWFKTVAQWQLNGQYEQIYQIEKNALRSAVLASEGIKRVRFYQRPTF